MTQQTPPPSDIPPGLREQLLESVRRYTAQSHAAHLLPHLRPGHRVLDFGCGLGTISAGLAAAVEPGELHGVDVDEMRVRLARTVAASQGHENATFHVGDVTALPFEDEFFDVAHGHDVLMWVPDTDAALAEVKRVLKPGGLIACREMICGSCFLHPDYSILRQPWDMFEEVLTVDGGHPQMGKELKARLDAAGFENASITAGFQMYSTPSEIEFVHGIAQRWLLSPDTTEKAIGYGASTGEVIESFEPAYERWRRELGAVSTIAFGEAIANKP